MFTRTVLLAVLSVTGAILFAQDAAGPAVPDGAPTGPYVLRRGDTLEIRVHHIPELNTSVQIRPDGMITMLLLDEIPAAGKTVAEITDVITEGLSRHYRTPKVAVMVRNFSSQNVYIGGEVGKPSVLPLVGSLTAVQALFQAGGFTTSADTENVVLIRQAGNGPPQTIRLNVDDVLNDRQQDVALQPADVVYVPKSYINVFIGGEVEKPGLVPLEKRMTLMAAILQAGGLKNTAKPKEILLLRDDGRGRPLTSTLDLKAVMEGETDTLLKPYDVVLVPKSKVAKANQWVDQYIRQMIPVTLSMGFSYVFGFPTSEPIF